MVTWIGSAALGIETVEVRAEGTGLWVKLIVVVVVSLGTLLVVLIAL